VTDQVVADVYLAIEDKPAGHWPIRWREQQTEARLLTAAVACAALGLVVSACVRSTDKGVLVVPLLITPQNLLGATLVPIKSGPLKPLAVFFSPVYWAHGGSRSEGDCVPWF
jgi:hypothetical protein